MPARVDSLSGLRSFQRLVKAAVTRPLAPGYRMQRRWSDGRPMTAVAAEFIKPNDRLTSFARLEIYNRMYWFRIIDSLYEDAPGLRAALGEFFAPMAAAVHNFDFAKALDLLRTAAAVHEIEI